MGQVLVSKLCASTIQTSFVSWPPPGSFFYPSTPFQAPPISPEPYTHILPPQNLR
ncbi:hypothetical protein BS17DRAFT_778053 [Gyrodon lividus]|nr:hypothetical protein BS17DRAFT_778053 [Gyrodon lividus]